MGPPSGLSQALSCFVLEAQTPLLDNHPGERSLGPGAVRVVGQGIPVAGRAEGGHEGVPSVQALHIHFQVGALVRAEALGRSGQGLSVLVLDPKVPCVPSASRFGPPPARLLFVVRQEKMGKGRCRQILGR